MKQKTEVKTAQALFTNRQLDVLSCWSEVSGEKAIADRLGVSVHTVHTHLKRMRQKVGVKRTFELYKYACKQGLLQ